MTTKPCYRLKLHKTYYDKGFFNLGREVDRFITQTDGAMQICLGKGQTEIQGRVSRKANLNGTPRIFGGAELRNWIQQHYELDAVVEVVILGPSRLWLEDN